MLTSCASTVSLRYKVPAQVDITEYNKIAIAPTEYYERPFYFNEKLTSSDNKVQLYKMDINSLIKSLANSNSSNLYKNLNSGSLFEIVKLDSMSSKYNSKELRELYDIDAIIIPKIASLDINEVINEKEKKVLINGVEKIVKEYKLVQEVYLRYEISIFDTKYNSLLYSDSYDYSYKTTNAIDTNDMYVPSFEFTLKSQLDNFNNEITHLIMPHTAIKDIKLMKNYDKVEAIEGAYNLVDDGLYRDAYYIFNDYYNNTGYIPAGYNAALLTASFADYNGAIDALIELSKISGDAEIYKAISVIRNISYNNNAANEQVDKIN